VFVIPSFSNWAAAAFSGSVTDCRDTCTRISPRERSSAARMAATIRSWSRRPTNAPCFITSSPRRRRLRTSLRRPRSRRLRPLPAPPPPPPPPPPTPPDPHPPPPPPHPPPPHHQGYVYPRRLYVREAYWARCIAGSTTRNRTIRATMAHGGICGCRRAAGFGGAVYSPRGAAMVASTAPSSPPPQFPPPEPGTTRAGTTWLCG